MPLTIEELAAEQGRDENLVLLRIWIEKALTPTPIELEGQPAAIRTDAGMRKNLFLRDNIIGLVAEPFSGFRVLVPHSILDPVL